MLIILLNPWFLACVIYLTMGYNGWVDTSDPFMNFVNVFGITGVLAGIIFVINVGVGFYQAAVRELDAEDAKDASVQELKIAKMELVGEVLGIFNNTQIKENCVITLLDGSKLNLAFYNCYHKLEDVPEEVLNEADYTTIVMESGICYRGKNES